MLPVHVMKFGGASLQSPAHMAKVGDLVRNYEPAVGTVLVVSALGKTTNRLERLVEAAVHHLPDFDAEWVELQHSHWVVVHELLHKEPSSLLVLFQELKQLLDGVRLLGDAPPRIFDRIMAYGELFSTCLLVNYLQELGLPAVWLDARNLIQTDLNYRAARVIWPSTQQAIREHLLPLLTEGYLPVVQGYIGRGTDGSTTTLGREGSDYSAALIGAALAAQKVVIWKDVPGVLSADPRILENYYELNRLSYEQAVEMTFYGASVIHPNTIRPLFEASIPLHVCSFLEPTKPGTLIHSHAPDLEPSFQITRGLACLRIQPRDLSFIDENELRFISDLIGRKNIRCLLMARTAISLILCLDARFNLVQELVSLLKERFSVHTTNDLVLIAEQHSDLSLQVDQANIILEQKLPNVRFLLVNEQGLNQWKSSYERKNAIGQG